MSANPHTSPLAVALFEAFARNGGNRPNDHFDRNAAEQWMQQALDECLPKPAAAQEAVGVDAYDDALDQLWKLAGGNDHPVYKRFLDFRDSFADPVTAAPAEFDRARETPRRQRAVELLLSMGYQWHGGEWIAASTPAAPEPSYLEYLDLQNHSLRRAIHAMMAKLVFLLDEDQFADIDAIALAAGVTPAAPGIDLTSLVPAEREKPELMMATWHEVAGWNACVAEIRRRIDASPKGALNEQFGSAEGFKAHFAEFIKLGRRHVAALYNSPRDEISMTDTGCWIQYAMQLLQLDSPKGGSDAREAVMAALVEAATAVERADADGELTDDLVDRLRAARDAAQAGDAEVQP